MSVHEYVGVGVCVCVCMCSHTFVTTWLFCFVSLAALCSMQDPSSPTRDRTQASCIGSVGVLATGLPAKSRQHGF